MVAPLYSLNVLQACPPDVSGLEQTTTVLYRLVQNEQTLREYMLSSPFFQRGSLDF
jgi:hypothetical protein